MRERKEGPLQQPPLLGEAHGLTFDRYQFGAVGPLEIGHMLRDRRLRQAELAGGVGVVERAAHGQKRGDAGIEHGILLNAFLAGARQTPSRCNARTTTISKTVHTISNHKFTSSTDRRKINPSNQRRHKEPPDG